MHNVLIIEQIQAFLQRTPSDDTMAVSYGALDAEIDKFWQSQSELECNTLLAKNIAYARNHTGMGDKEKRELNDFYSTFRHCGTQRKFHQAINNLAYDFYRKASHIFRRSGKEYLASQAEDKANRLDMHKVVKDLIEGSRYTTFEQGMLYYSPTMLQDGRVLAATSDGTIRELTPTGSLDVPELHVEDRIQSFIIVDDTIFLVGSYGKTVYEFDCRLEQTACHHPAPEGKERVQSCRTTNGFALFPYNNTIHLYDRSWCHTKTISLPQANLASEPCYHDGLVYFRNANVFHQAAELLVIDEKGRISCLCDGLDFAPKCSFPGGVCSWPNRTSLYLSGQTDSGHGQRILPLESFNELEEGFFAKGYDIIQVDNDYWLFFTMENKTNQSDYHVAMLYVEANIFHNAIGFLPRIPMEEP